MQNIPEIRLGLISVSRDCFPVTLSAQRRGKVAQACKEVGIDLYECPITVENEVQAKTSVEDVLGHDVNALIVYLGNFGPETAETLIARFFDGQ